ncbi:DUF3306 domain-containing protein [Ferrovibrio sp.]|jgi:hypothetical protein|uniref:DUF3306 domain-containing protein n=1 Tax=Ferrovibrio sp. TaxID=1917215 RepID=UPI0035B48F09
MTRDSDKPEDDGQGGFLARWSRRKAEAREEKPAEMPAETDAVAEEGPEIDPASLPPIESLTEASDFSVFLKKGVPPALRAAALRKLWLVEPSVVNYQPLVEYNWDFTAPGYGELLPTDDIAKYVKNVFEGGLPKTADHETKPEVTPAEPAQQIAAEAPAEPVTVEPVEPADEAVPDLAPEPAPVYVPPRRRHGGALPG